MRNIQLGSFSLVLGLLAMVYFDGSDVAARGFFSGYGPMVWLCVSLHSLGGLAVAMVVKYADNVVRRPLVIAWNLNWVCCWIATSTDWLSPWNRSIYRPIQFAILYRELPWCGRLLICPSPGEVLCHQHLHQPFVLDIYYFPRYGALQGICCRNVAGETAE